MGQMLSEFDCKCNGGERHDNCLGPDKCVECGCALCCKVKSKTKIKDQLHMCPLCQMFMTKLREYDTVMVSTSIF